MNSAFRSKPSAPTTHSREELFPKGEKTPAKKTPRRGHTPLPALLNVPLQTHTRSHIQACVCRFQQYPIQTVQILFPVVWMS